MLHGDALRTARSRSLAGRMRRLTITIPDASLAPVQRDVAAGAAPSMSAYLSDLAASATREHQLLAVLDELDRELGAPSAEDVAWAHRVLDRAP